MKPTDKVWRTNDNRLIPVTELGDQHLINILKKMEMNRQGKDTPTPRFSVHIMSEFYGDLVIEAVRRGLFDWTPDRKYLSAIHNDIKAKAALNTVSVTVTGRFRPGAIVYDMRREGK